MEENIICGKCGKKFSGIDGKEDTCPDCLKNILRLEYIRREIRAERVSYGELAELVTLIPFIEEGDNELLEAAGVPEGKE